MIGFVVFGLFVGALARLLKPGRQHLSLPMTLLLGLAGSVIGGLIANLLGTGDVFELDFLGSVVAIVSAVVLLGFSERAAENRARDEKHAHSEPGGPRSDRSTARGEGDAAARLAEGKRDWGGP